MVVVAAAPVAGSVVVVDVVEAPVAGSVVVVEVVAAPVAGSVVVVEVVDAAGAVVLVVAAGSVVVVAVVEEVEDDGDHRYRDRPLQGLEVLQYQPQGTGGISRSLADGSLAQLGAHIAAHLLILSR